jgi:signal peptidase
MTDKAGVRALSVEQWRALALSGQAVAVRIRVNGDSMRPLIRKGRDVVTIVPMDRSPKRGDIVLFPAKRLGGDYVLHRVVRVDGARLLTRGDSCAQPDGWIDADMVWGRAARVERGKLAFDPNRPLWRAVVSLGALLHPIRRWSALPGRACRAVRRACANFMKQN